MVYCYTKLSKSDLGICRVFGSGLGNMLFPWARAMVAAKSHGLVEIWPTWRQIFQRDGLRDVLKETLGLQGLRGLRNYQHLFAPTGEQVTGFQKLGLLMSRKHIGEEGFAADPRSVADGSIVVFQGEGRRFADILPHHAFLRAELLKRCGISLREVQSRDFSGSISIHVRMGDFIGGESYRELEQNPANRRLPMSWYVEKITQLRSRLGGSAPVHVFSDGTDAELAEILALPDCRRLGFGSALADLFAMARANVLICSCSSLNRWAAFLGRPPAVHPRGMLQTPLYYDQPDAEVESGPGEDLPESFLRAVELAGARPRPVEVPL